MAVASVTARLIDAVIAAGTAPLLRAAGFRKAGRSFHRTADGLFQVVQFQASRWNTPAAAQFTVNLNLVQPYFHGVWTGHPFPNNPASAAPVVTRRIGALMPGARDHRWEVTPATEVGPLGARVAGAVAEYGLPFLAGSSDVRQIIRELEAGRPARAYPDPGLCRAILLASTGDREAAHRALQAVNQLNKVPAFAETIRLIAGRLGLSEAAELGAPADAGRATDSFPSSGSTRGRRR